MCRFVLYQGRRGLRLSELLQQPAHALVQQALAPKELHPNLPSADGWGAVWYEEGTSEPGAYRCVLPMWRDANLPTLTPHLSSHQFLAATRVATGSSELTITSVMPFVHRELAFAHNGELIDFEGSFLKPLRDRLRPEAQRLPRSVTDSAHLFAYWLELMASAVDLSHGADRLVAGVRSLAEELGRGAILNLLLTSPTEAVAIRYATPEQAHASLYWRTQADACLVASEPLDDDAAWQEVPKNSRLTFRDGALQQQRALP